MADQKELLVLLKTVFESAGYDELKKATEDIEKKQQEQAQGSKDRKDSTDKEAISVDALSKKIAEWAGGYLAVSKAWGYVSEAFKGAVEDEQSQLRLAAAVRVMANATEENIDTMEDWIDAASKEYAVADDHLRPALQRLATATHDVGQAQVLLTMALDAQKAGFADLGEATQTFAMLLTRGEVVGRGPFSQMLRQMVKESKDAHHGHLDHAEVLGKLQQKLADTAKQVNPLNEELERNKVAWAESKEQMGQALMWFGQFIGPIMEGAAVSITMVEVGFMKFVGGIKIGVDAIWSALKYAGGTFKDFAVAVKEGLSGNMNAWDDFTAASIKRERQLAEDAKARSAEWAAIGEQGDEMLEETLAKWQRHSEGLKDVVGGEKAALAGLAEAWRNAGKDSDEAAKKAEEERKAKLKEALDNAEMERKNQEDREKAAAEWQRIADEQAEKEQQLEDLRVQRRINSGKMTAAQEIAWLKEKQKRLQDEAKAAEGNVDAQIKAEQKLMANEQRLAAAEKKLDQQRVASRKQMTSALIGLGKQMAGENAGMARAMQHVEAGVTLFEGITGAVKGFNAMGGYPMGVPALVAGLATTATQVASIEGIGFDDPANDAIMRAASRKWASDMARETIMGHADGWKEGLEDSRRGGGTTINNHVTNPGSTYHTKNFYIDAAVLDTGRDQTLRDLSVKMREMDRLTDEGKVR